MGNVKLVIKYKDKYFCEKDNDKISLIRVPNYNLKVTNFGNVLTFIKIFLTGYLTDKYSSNVSLSNADWLEIEYNLIAITGKECLYEYDKDTYIYDIDKLPYEYRGMIDLILSKILKSLPRKIVYKSEEELIEIQKNYEKKKSESALEFEDTNDFEVQEQVSPSLLNFIKKYNAPRTNKDVLLMFSGGKDSTLSAIRLRKLGFNVHFVHFDNGYERDNDKPFLTYKETFSKYDGYYFDYRYSSVNISDEFHQFFHNQIKGENSVDKKIKSEVCCLSCRSAMYIKAIEIAKKEGIRFIADGARISQKFMLEQVPMILRYQELCKNQGIILLCPVLTINNDTKLIEEMIANGFSSKGWESKCLIGKPAVEKSEEDEQNILNYYENAIKPKAEILLLKNRGE